MTQANTQVERLRAEALHRPVADPGVVTLRYRLQPADLPEGKRSVVVRTVSAQGIETAAPVVHFEGIAKPLLMDATNVAAMTQQAGSPLYSEWVGVKVTLYVISEGDAERIRLRPGPRRKRRTTPATPLKHLVAQWGVMLLWLVILGALTYSAYFLASQWQSLQQLLPLFPRL